MTIATLINLTWDSLWALPALVLIAITLIGVGVCIAAIREARMPDELTDADTDSSPPLTMKRVVMGTIFGLIPLACVFIAATYACLEHA